MILIAILAVPLIIGILFLKNLHELLLECAPHNLLVAPSNVWFLLIPVFNLLYPLTLFSVISESIKREFEERKHPQKGNYLRMLGLIIASLSFVTIAFFVVAFLSLVIAFVFYSESFRFLSLLFAISAFIQFVLLIIYWIKTDEYKNQLRKLPKLGNGFSDNPDTLD